MANIEVSSLSMTYRVPVRGAGLRAALGALTRPQFREVPAVRGVSFQVGQGEIVGFLGPNGAGKTTTLKMLAGVLTPTSGNAQVLGHTPWRREAAYLRRVAMIRGSRPLAAPGELTVLDALRFQGRVYDVPDREFRANLAELTDLLHLQELLPRQVRALSLDERMRSGLAFALLYRPQVLFLDEPTIGLDVGAVGMIRSFLSGYGQQTGATIVLTSHYMADVEALCSRVILIDKGEIRHDGDLAALSARLAPHKLLRLTLAPTGPIEWSRYGEVEAEDGETVTLRVRRSDVPGVTARLLAELPVLDLSVREPPLEGVLAQVYREGVGA
ncbi:ABC transporter related protein [Deinococcus aerius]|uniref:ABC transporter related protein n=1 Tax=Deinococcus aerius TaxID=200253 RepID=A0A2I9D621_9DEIO|nr:ATP-binding cassette domain-containing protein [Deinococcus aerius]GBF06136.1 ABC transporter related protein [Deinococcus aerius]